MYRSARSFNQVFLALWRLIRQEANKMQILGLSGKKKRETLDRKRKITYILSVRNNRTGTSFISTSC